MRRRRTIEERRRFWEELRRSGDSVRAVAKRVGVSAATAYLWKKAGPVSEPPVFAQVVLARPAPALKLQAGRGTILVERGFDPELLREVVDALGAEP